MQEAYMKLIGPGGKYEIGLDSWPIGNNQRVKDFPCFKKGPKTMRQYYDICFRKASSETCLVFGNERYSYAEVWSSASALGNCLVKDFNIQKGDRVVIASRNLPEWIFAFIATSSIGAIAVPMNGWWKGEELNYGLGDCQPKVMICDETRLKRSMPYLTNLGIQAVVVRSKNTYTAPHITHYEGAVRKYVGWPMPSDNGCHTDDFAAIMYTSGTTSHPKGVVQTHRAYVQQMTFRLMLEDIKQFMPQGRFPPSALCPIPLFHVTALVHILLWGFADASKCVLMEKWDAGNALRLIERERVTRFTGVPTMGQDLMEHPDFKKYDTSSLRVVSGGGAPTPKAQVFKTGRDFKNAMPAQGYGLTETCGGFAHISGDEYKLHPGSCGKPNSLAPASVLLIDVETGKVIPPGKGLGELLVRSGLVMNHYWRKPEKTEEAIVTVKGHGEGWFRTGDIAEIDKEGYIYLRDRAKDIIIRGGENISCSEVESAFFETSGDYILECAAFGVKDSRLGEVPGVMIVLKNGVRKVDPVFLRNRLRDKLSTFKIPKAEHIFFSDKILPRGATGKILKRVIRDSVNLSLQKQSRAKL